MANKLDRSRDVIIIVITSQFEILILEIEREAHGLIGP